MDDGRSVIDTWSWYKKWVTHLYNFFALTNNLHRIEASDLICSDIIVVEFDKSLCGNKCLPGREMWVCVEFNPEDLGGTMRPVKERICLSKCFWLSSIPITHFCHNKCIHYGIKNVIVHKECHSTSRKEVSVEPTSTAIVALYSQARL